MKKFLYNLLPDSLKEVFKLKYYNAKNNRFSFAMNESLYVTREGSNWEVVTKRPMYFIVKDINKYEKFYKVKSNDIVFDAGANDGSLAVIYSKKVGNKGKVFAFEPDSVNIESLKYNVFLNNENSNIKLIEKALWNKEETITFFEAGTVASSIFYQDKNSKKVNMKATSIDAFVSNNKINQLNFIKMDIEGAEIEALEGAVNTILKYQPNFAIASYHIVDNKLTHIAVEGFFKRINYPYKTVFFDDGEILTYAGNSVNK